MLIKTDAYYGYIGTIIVKYHIRNIKQIDIWEEFPIGFFDGACDQRRCGCGAHIVIEPNTF